MALDGRILILVRVVQREAPGDIQSAVNELAVLLTRFVWNCLGRFPRLTTADREDLCQDICVQLLRDGIFRFRGETEVAFLAFVRTCAVNATLNHFKAQHDTDDVDEYPDLHATDDPVADASDKERLQGVVKCAAELPAVDHEIFWMRVNDWKLEDIAQALDLPFGTVTAKEHRARQRIRSCLEQAGITVGA